MRNLKDPGFQDRLSTAAEARKAALEKYRARPGPDDPAFAERQAARRAARLARDARAQERKAAREAAEQAKREAAAQAAREAELAEQAAREAAAQAEREAELARQAEREAEAAARAAYRAAREEDRRLTLEAERLAALETRKPRGRTARKKARKDAARRP